MPFKPPELFISAANSLMPHNGLLDALNRKEGQIELIGYAVEAEAPSEGVMRVPLVKPSCRENPAYTFSINTEEMA